MMSRLKQTQKETGGEWTAGRSAQGKEMNAAEVLPEEAEFQARLAAFHKATRFRRFPGVGWLGPALGIGGIMAWVVITLPTGSFPLKILAALILLGAFGLMHHLFVRIPRRHREFGSANGAAAQLAMTGDLRALPPLIDVWLTMADLSLAYEIVPAVTRLLPLLDANTAEALPPRTHKQLRQLLAMSGIAVSGLQEPTYKRYYAHFTVALLDALVRLGDVEAISAVEAATKLRGNSEAVTLVREAAKDCHSHLLGLLNRDELPRTLLRASDATPAAPAELLRPARGATEPDASVLLRPNAVRRDA